MGWLLIILLLLALFALSATLGAVAVRPSQATVRAATVALLAFPAVVLLIAIIGAIAY